MRPTLSSTKNNHAHNGYTPECVYTIRLNFSAITPINPVFEMNKFSFERAPIHQKTPKISVICINKNGAKFIEDTILSVLSQTFEDFEFLVADGGSADDSLDIIRKYSFVTLLPGTDSSRSEGLRRGVASARGRYLMITTSTDGYLSRTWFRDATAVLDTDPSVSLVFGSSVEMNQSGTLGRIAYPSIFSFNGVPSKEKWHLLWLMDGLSKSYFPELNYCVRADVFRRLTEGSQLFPELNPIDPILRFHFEFNRLGYLPHYLPTLANFGRVHEGQEQHSRAYESFLKIYADTLDKYRSGVILGTHVCCRRGSDGEPLSVFEYSPLQRMRLLLSRAGRIARFR